MNTQTPNINASRVPATPAPWLPDLGNGRFQNPVLLADYSDPDVIRDGDDYWLTASSFNCTPGLPILHSRDLVNWTIVNYAIKNNPDPRNVFDLPQHGCGVWAPAIRKHAGKFWIFFPLPDEGIYVTTATDPRGQWSEPHCLVAGKGLIDPCPLWDEDGKAYMVHAFANSRCGIKHKLRVCPMAPDASKLLGEGHIVFDEPVRHPTCEGPKIDKWNGYYYIAAPAGGVKTGWQLILRSKDIYGPYEEKIVLEQGPSPVNGPHQGAIVDDVNGNWWFVHFQDAGVYGRIVHTQPVTWKDGWPLMGIDTDGNGIGEPVLTHAKPVAGQPVAAPQTSDEFDSTTLGVQWQWHANHKDDWHSLAARPGYLQLRTVRTDVDFAKVPNLLMQKFPARSFRVEADVHLKTEHAAAQTGLIVMGKTHAALVVRNTGNGRELALLINNETTATHPIPNCGGKLRVDVRDGGLCVFSHSIKDAPFTTIGDAFQASEGLWIGTKFGVFARAIDADVQGHADIDYLRVTSL